MVSVEPSYHVKGRIFCLPETPIGNAVDNWVKKALCLIQFSLPDQTEREISSLDTPLINNSPSSNEMHGHLRTSADRPPVLQML
jgi:hypothetical protein